MNSCEKLQTLVGFGRSRSTLISRRHTMIQDSYCFQSQAEVPVVPSIDKETPHTLTSPAYELKFLIDENRSGEVLAWARKFMAPDPHVEPSLGDAYRISSLYLDTQELDAFCHRGSAARSKFRLRRYGDEPAVFLERKRKKRDCVEKRRVPVLDTDMRLLQDPDAPPDWTGRWFHKRLRARRLQPICQVSVRTCRLCRRRSERPSAPHARPATRLRAGYRMGRAVLPERAGSAARQTHSRAEVSRPSSRPV